ncbi:hypothetical protein [Sphingomonas leidyi]|uniref:hypothetical protein n=2 Tax=Sphingomonas TaxID=13687 RepID=UPI001AD2290D|nr:hypothetical protein [Sphingomonas sp.]
MRMALIGFALAIAAPGTAQAQDKPADDPSIVVRGQKGVPPREARKFVRQVVTSTEGQLARFVDPVCPFVLGLPRQYAMLVEDRIRDDARQAGIRTGAEGRCQPNLVIMVADNADAVVRKLRQKFSGLFLGVSAKEMSRAMREGPVHVWSAVQVRNENGQAPRQTESDGPPTLRVYGASLVDLQTQQAVLQSIMVLDADALLGKTLTQISDYVAMRTLAGARPPREGVEANTILTLFDPQGAPPPAMTGIDRGFLAGLYKVRPNGTSVTQMSTISRQIVKDSKPRTERE